jgi:hypothetical protein
VSRWPEEAAPLGWWRQAGPPAVCRPHQGNPAADFSAETVAAGMADSFLAVSFVDRVAAAEAAFTKRVIRESYLFYVSVHKLPY